MIDLTRLRLLRELTYRGTMTAVADAFGMTSSAVSQQLATLERETGTILLDRIGRRVQLTDAGARLALHAETILQAVEVAEHDLQTAHGKPYGECVIACFSSFAKAHLVPVASRLKMRFPELRICIHELETPDAIEALREGRCDIAVQFTYDLVPRPDLSGMTSRKLADEPVVLALPKCWQTKPGPLDLKSLADKEWIVGSRQTDDLVLAERACAAAGFAPKMAHTVDDYDLLLRMVAAGLGVGFVPTLGLRFSNTKAVTIHTVRGMPLRRHIYAVLRTAVATSPVLQVVMSELEKIG
ncbi:LysR family transcriptional regulator [Dyella mobilis]|uniref:LysR family transcriptional regulator n=1 Tax=Dyella mobilis TaxID=1849582 RepID=A0ABS2KC49_9GAMM|nr:LysR substrate-binding domain-containing protein [Dyella mobilis]MBM7128747.1 LysR family transcriptional regulator [Dyella mobilis]GLQ99076.1 LysR family transcriptional regulator [Dyella mobilis]